MRVDKTYYGDYRVTDEMPFTLYGISVAANKIFAQDEVNVADWPVQTDYNERTGYFSILFVRPVNDEDYENVREVPADLRTGKPVLA